MLVRVAKTVQIGSGFALRTHPKTTVFTQIRQFSDKTNETTSNESNETKTKSDVKLGSFAKAFQEFEKINDKPIETPAENVPFKKLLRQSKMVDVSKFESVWKQMGFLKKILNNSF